MSKEKDLSTEVITVLHGEVLGPGDEGYEPRKKGETAQEQGRREHREQRETLEREAYLNQQRFYQQMGNGQNFQWSQRMGNQMDYQQASEIFRCIFHSPSWLGPCKACGRY